MANSDAEKLIHDGALAMQEGEFSTASSCYRDALLISHRLGDVPTIRSLLRGLAQLAILQDKPERALCLLSWLGANPKPMDAVEQSLPGPSLITIMKAATMMLGGEEAGLPSWERGKSMSLEEAVGVAVTEASETRNVKYCEIRFKGFAKTALLSVIHEDSRHLVGLFVEPNGKPTVIATGTRISLGCFSREELEEMSPCEISPVTGRLVKSGA